ncbi:MAG TPA: flagellar biosynthetic protein FliO [Kofleriaceae bacterium]|jgi:flagellar protein FliO/FliZ|nr:flagellar biosynthetic protein FliO [Kofleriaceae bacterium]
MPGNGAVGASYGDLLVTSLVVLGGACIAAFVVVRVVGRFLATGPVRGVRGVRGAHLLEVVARLPLEPRRSLYVVQVAGKTLLVGTSEMGLSVLSELDGDEVRARTVAPRSFGELVRSAWQRQRRARHAVVSEQAHAGTVRDVAALAPQLQTQAPPLTAAESTRPSTQGSRAPEPPELREAGSAREAALVLGAHIEEVR